MNRRHPHFQCGALPTELPSLTAENARPARLSPRPCLSTQAICHKSYQAASFGRTYRGMTDIPHDYLMHVRVYISTQRGTHRSGRIPTGSPRLNRAAAAAPGGPGSTTNIFLASPPEQRPAAARLPHALQAMPGWLGPKSRLIDQIRWVLPCFCSRAESQRWGGGLWRTRDRVGR